MVGFPFDASYFGAKNERVFLLPFLPGRLRRVPLLIPAPIMTVGFPSMRLILVLKSSRCFSSHSWCYCIWHHQDDLIPALMMAGFPYVASNFWLQSWTVTSLPVLYIWHYHDNLIPAPMMEGFPFDASYFGAKVERVFLLPFLISHISKTILFQHEWRRVPCDPSYFGAKTEWVFLFPFLFLVSGRILIPAPMMTGFPTLRLIFGSKVERLLLFPFLVYMYLTLPRRFNPSTNDGWVYLRCVLFLAPKSSRWEQMFIHLFLFLTSARKFHSSTSDGRVFLRCVLF